MFLHIKKRTKKKKITFSCSISNSFKHWKYKPTNTSKSSKLSNSKHKQNLNSIYSWSNLLLLPLVIDFPKTCFSNIATESNPKNIYIYPGILSETRNQINNDKAIKKKRRKTKSWRRNTEIYLNEEIWKRKTVAVLQIEDSNSNWTPQNFSQWIGKKRAGSCKVVEDFKRKDLLFWLQFGSMDRLRFLH